MKGNLRAGSYTMNDSSEYRAFLGTLNVVLEVPPTDDSIVLLEDFSTYVRNYSVIWKNVNRRTCPT